ncbi:MAG: cytochrome C [Alphaproteobacteria bacterium]|nr:cytochrome C [Alphaproteobacteria bacterium]
MSGAWLAIWTLGCSLALGEEGWEGWGERGERGEHEEHERHGNGGWSGGPGVEPTTDAVWLTECGSCHMPYSPGLLPARAWAKMLGDLQHHFGDDASVDEATLARLKLVADTGAAEKAAAPLSAWIAAATRGTTPDRISTIPALRAEHLEELSTRFVTSNAEIRSWSNCKACHPGAVEGRFSEHEIRIPR